MTTDSLPHIATTDTPVAAVKPRRYHPALVTLHWLIAILILGAFLLVQGGENERGRFRPNGQPGNFPQQGFQNNGQGQGNGQGFGGNGNDQGQGFPQGGFPPGGFRQQNVSVFSTLGFHMIFGIVVLALLVIRLIVRYTTKRPEWASAGNKFLDVIGELTHLGLYLLTFGMVITGIILADQRGILASAFGIGSTPTPGNFRRGGFGFSLGFLHGGIWTLLVLLILLHVGAALYHQFILKDNLLSRMWWGKDKS